MAWVLFKNLFINPRTLTRHTRRVRVSIVCTTNPGQSGTLRGRSAPKNHRAESS